jgi:Ca-activated chloride channel homolog
MKALLLAALFALPVAAAAADDPSVMLVLDASGSMWGQIGGVSKIEIARDAVAALVDGWPEGHALGLVAYGHRQKGQCSDIETLIPAAPLDRAAFMRTVRGLNPKGMTPLSAAVLQAAEALRHHEQKATVILVSDGEETCNLDPCEVGRRLEASGVDFVAHVIGFDVLDPLHQAQLKCLASTTGGQYFNARDARELVASLRTLAQASTEPALPPAQATLEAADNVAALAPLEVAVTGPGDAGDFVGLFATGEAEVPGDYAWIEQASQRIVLDAPARPGSFELRYVSPRRTQPVLARRPVEVSDISATLDAPASEMAGGVVVVRAQGPGGDRHWIGFAPAGAPIGVYLDYARPTGSTSELTLKVPSEPGDYELRYVLNEAERVLVSRPIRIEEAEASLDAPDSATAASELTVRARGPVGSGHWIGFAPKGSDKSAYLDYARPTGPQSEVRLRTPVAPGEYELRYVLNESERVLVSRPIRIEEARAALEAPEAVAAGSAVGGRATGPVGAAHWIGFAPKGAPAGSYLDWKRPSGITSELTLTAPSEPGEYELRYVLNESERVLISRPIRVHAAD